MMMRRRDDPAPPDLFPTASSPLNDLDLDFDKWRAMLQAACRERSKLSWRIGDLLLFGKRRYGNRYATVLDATDLSFQTLMNIRAVVRKFKTSRRREVLSFGHHADVAALPVEIQDELLDAAEKEHLTRKQLRARISQHNLKKVVAQVTKSEPLIPPSVKVTHEDHGVVGADFINSLVRIDKPDPVGPQDTRESSAKARDRGLDEGADRAEEDTRCA